MGCHPLYTKNILRSAKIDAKYPKKATKKKHLKKGAGRKRRFRTWKAIMFRGKLLV